MTTINRENRITIRPYDGGGWDGDECMGQDDGSDHLGGSDGDGSTGRWAATSVDDGGGKERNDHGSGCNCGCRSIDGGVPSPSTRPTPDSAQ